MITDFDSGLWRFGAIRPGAQGEAAAHLNLRIVARGINIGLATRLYFPEDAAAHAADPVLRMVEPQRRATLVATPLPAREGRAPPIASTSACRGTARPSSSTSEGPP